MQDRVRSGLRSFERLVREDKAGLVAKRGSVANKPEKAQFTGGYMSILSLFLTPYCASLGVLKPLLGP